MIYEHPLAYVLGLEGIALMRSYNGGHDRAFVEARLAEIRRFLDDGSLADAAVEVAPVDTVQGYRIWSQTYDGPDTTFDLDEPFVREIVEALPAGVTYRHLVGDYVRAALAVGLQVRRCEEPLHPPGEPRERTDVLAPWDVWPWALCDLAPEAANAVIAGTPSMLLWHFQR